MRILNVPWYMLDMIVGFDESEEEEDEEDADDEEEDGGEDGDEDEEDSEDPKVKEANDKFRGERKARRLAERELKKLQKAETRRTTKKEEAQTQLQQDLDAEKGKTTKLAERLRVTAVDGAIRDQATKLKFRDLDDAISLVDRKLIDVDQDDEDPADIDIDEDTVKAAVKALADKKPHLLLADGEEEPSGRQFGGRNKKKDPLSDEALRDMYPALRR